MLRSVFLLVPLLLLTGCTYEYNLVEPQQYARHIGQDGTRLTITPLEYEMRSYDNHLILRINNPTDDTITLLGQESSVVDPRGMSHPVHGDVIAPRSYIVRVLPPLPRYYYAPGPEWGFGIGGGGWHHRGYWSGGVWYGGPTYYAVEAPDTPFSWYWEEEGSARLTLVYDRNKKVFHDIFLFSRQKM